MNARAQATLRMLGVVDAETVQVQTDEGVPDWIVKLWESRGYKVTQPGVIQVWFSDNLSCYTYPLQIEKVPKRRRIKEALSHGKQ